MKMRGCFRSAVPSLLGLVDVAIETSPSSFFAMSAEKKPHCEEEVAVRLGGGGNEDRYEGSMRTVC
jgi:hypothetical protein